MSVVGGGVKAECSLRDTGGRYASAARLGLLRDVLHPTLDTYSSDCCPLRPWRDNILAITSSL